MAVFVVAGGSRRLRVLNAPERAGFTLVELMIAIAILGIIAALAVPAFVGYVARSKTGEVPANLNAMFKAAAAYYTRDIAVGTPGGVNTGFATGCIVPMSTRYEPIDLTGQKQPFPGTDLPWRALDFRIADYVYYSYAVWTPAPGTGACFNSATNLANVYTFEAQGDLDFDTELSNFQLAAGVDRDGQLYHARGLYIENELE